MLFAETFAIVMNVRQIRKSYSVDRVYNIGIEVRQGRGRYSYTNIVMFTPRYQLDNRSSRKLAYAQRHVAKGSVSRSEMLIVFYGIFYFFYYSYFRQRFHNYIFCTVKILRSTNVDCRHDFLYLSCFMFSRQMDSFYLLFQIASCHSTGHGSTSTISCVSV